MKRLPVPILEFNKSSNNHAWACHQALSVSLFCKISDPPASMMIVGPVFNFMIYIYILIIYLNPWASTDVRVAFENG